MLSMVAGQVSTQVVYGAKEKCTTIENDEGGSGSICVTQGKDPTLRNEFCDNEFGCFEEERAVTHREGAEIKTDSQRECREQNDDVEDGVICTKEK